MGYNSDIPTMRLYGLAMSHMPSTNILLYISCSTLFGV